MRLQAILTCALGAVVVAACSSSGGSTGDGNHDGGVTSSSGSNDASTSSGGDGSTGEDSGGTSSGGSDSGGSSGTNSDGGGSSGTQTDSGSGGGHDAGACGTCPTGFTCASGGYCVSKTGVPAFDHVYVIMMENSSSDITNSSAAPYINGLMSKYTYLANYSTSYHPSLPNYLDLTSGSDQGLSCDCDANSSEGACGSFCLGGCFCGGITAKHLGDQLDAISVQWRNYGEGMGNACNLTASQGGNATNFAPKHVPFMYYKDVGENSTVCKNRVVDYSSFAADLAAGTYRFGMVAPNLCNDMHGDTGCPGTNEITQGDNWLKTEVPKILATKGFQPGGKDVLFIVWDEQTGSTGGAGTPMLCIPIGPLVKPGPASQKAYTHESLLATIEDAFGVGRLGNAASIPSPVNDVWK